MMDQPEWVQEAGTSVFELLHFISSCISEKIKEESRKQELAWADACTL